MPLTSTNWGLKASVPVKNPADMLYIELLDATALAGRTDAHFGKDLALKPLGRCGVRIAGLIDGHVSRGNQLGLDSFGGNLFATLHMVRFPASLHV